jgi:hypothetical protein
MDRHTRKLINNKQDTLLNFSDGSISRLVEGQLSVGQKLGEHLSLVLRKGKRLFKIHLSPDGDFYVDKHHFVKGNAFVDGTVYGNQIHWYAHNFTSTTSAKTYLEFNRDAGSTTIHSYNKFVVPYDGRLIRAELRSEFAGGNTVMGFHRASNGTTNPSTTPIESITRNIASADTTYEYRFTGAASFNRGDVVSISIDPTSNIHDVNVTTIWSFNILK